MKRTPPRCDRSVDRRTGAEGEGDLIGAGVSLLRDV